MTFKQSKMDIDNFRERVFSSHQRIDGITTLAVELIESTKHDTWDKNHVENILMRVVSKREEKETFFLAMQLEMHYLTNKIIENNETFEWYILYWMEQKEQTDQRTVFRYCVDHFLGICETSYALRRHLTQTTTTTFGAMLASVIGNNETLETLLLLEKHRSDFVFFRKFQQQIVSLNLSLKQSVLTLDAFDQVCEFVGCTTSRTCILFSMIQVVCFKTFLSGLFALENNEYETFGKDLFTKIIISVHNLRIVSENIIWFGFHLDCFRDQFESIHSCASFPVDFFFKDWKRASIETILHWCCHEFHCIFLHNKKFRKTKEFFDAVCLEKMPNENDDEKLKIMINQAAKLELKRYCPV